MNGLKFYRKSLPQWFWLLKLEGNESALNGRRESEVMVYCKGKVLI